MATTGQTKTETSDSGKIEFGNIPANKAGDPGTSKFVVASYNIRYAVGRYLISSGLLRKARLLSAAGRREKVSRNIELAAAAFRDAKVLPRVDVLGLQEADKETGRAGGHHVARELAEALQMSWIHVPAGIPRGTTPQPRQWWLDFEEQINIYDPGDTGIALLSHFPLHDVVRIDLPWSECGWRPRLSMAATVSIGAGKIRVFNSHIDPHSAVHGQLEQLQVVLYHAAKSVEPVIMLGDFNTLSNRKCLEVRRLLESHGYVTPFATGTATWRGAAIRLHADWIFVRGLKIARWGVSRPLNVSDHWPIWAEIELPRKQD